MGKWSVCGEVVTERGRRRACVNVSGGRVESVTASPRYDLAIPGSRDIIVVPAVIDIHVHLRGLRQSYKESVASGTRAAALGGVALVADMPNTEPGIDSLEVLRERLEEVAAESYVNYMLYAAVPRDPAEARLLAGSPAVAGFKVYPEDLASAREERLCAALRAAHAHGKPVVLHPEDPELLSIEAGWDRDTARPCHAEVSAVLAIRELAERCGARPRIHLTHVTCPETLRLARAHGLTVDVTPHHLLLPLYGWQLLPHECYAKVNPPIRGLAASLGLLSRMFTHVDAIASDHAPHAPSEKAQHPLLCPPGAASLEHWPLVLVRLFDAIGELRAFVQLCSRGPASILGLRARGCLEPGCVADVAVFARRLVRLHTLTASKARWSPYAMWHGYSLELLSVGGRLVVVEGKLVGSA